MVAGCETKHDGEGIGHEVLHDGITEGGVGMEISSFRGDKVVGVFEFVEAVVDVGGDEETVAVNFLGVLVVDCMEIVGEEFWEDPVWVGLVGWKEGADNLGVVVKIGVREVVGDDEGEGRGGEVVVDRSGGVSAGVLAMSGGGETRRKVTHVENWCCGVG